MSSSTGEQDGRELQTEVEAFAARRGAWRSYRIHLENGVHTMPAPGLGHERRLGPVLQVAADLLPIPLERARVLDLACSEGLFAVEFARRGAQVVAVEGRAGDVERLEFVREKLGLQNLDARQGDVRELSAESLGQFDLVLCLGILYHLDAPDLFDFAARVAEMTRHVALIDTHVSVKAKAEATHGGRDYAGRTIWEHDEAASLEERTAAYRASLDNPSSFWLTRPSLYRVLAAAGFSSVCEVRVPRPSNLSRDRLTVAALKGTPVGQILSAPDIEPDLGWLEGEQHAVHFRQTKRGVARAWLGRKLPAGLRRRYRHRRRRKA